MCWCLWEVKSHFLIQNIKFYLFIYHLKYALRPIPYHIIKLKCFVAANITALYSGTYIILNVRVNDCCFFQWNSETRNGMWEVSVCVVLFFMIAMLYPECNFSYHHICNLHIFKMIKLIQWEVSIFSHSPFL